MAGQRALIAGVGGQDGSYLAELLIEKGYEAYGLGGLMSAAEEANVAKIRDRLELIEADQLDPSALAGALRACKPHEVYNLAFPSFAPTTWDDAVISAELGAVGVTNLLEGIRSVDPAIRFYQASSSEIFGKPAQSPQSETTPVSPLTPYAVAKVYGHFITRSYRVRFGLHASSGILYNHESPRRRPDFVTRKITRGAAEIKLGLRQSLSLGNLDARRDWGYARDYVEGMWLMLQSDEPDDYVIATGITHSVRELVAAAFEHAGLDWEQHVEIDASLERGSDERHDVVGDPTKARERLGWRPRVGFEELVRIMVDADLEELSKVT
jgi:GDPmannose 4,6-dehydratase